MPFKPSFHPSCSTSAAGHARTASASSDQEAIDRLATLGREKGHLSTAIIAAADGILSAESYRRRFGSLFAAYALAGYQPEPYQRRAETTARYRERITRMADEIAAKINGLAGVATNEPRSGILRLGMAAVLRVGSARAVTDGAKGVRRTIHADRHANAELTLIPRMNSSNDTVGTATCCPWTSLRRRGEEFCAL